MVARRHIALALQCARRIGLPTPSPNGTPSVQAFKGFKRRADLPKPPRDFKIARGPRPAQAKRTACPGVPIAEGDFPRQLRSGPRRVFRIDHAQLSRRVANAHRRRDSGAIGFPNQRCAHSRAFAEGQAGFHAHQSVVHAGIYDLVFHSNAAFDANRYFRRE